MHCVNLAVRDVVKNVSIMSHFLHFANDLIIFLRNSPKRFTIVRNTAIMLEIPQTHIRPLCPTRFTARSPQSAATVYKSSRQAIPVPKPLLIILNFAALGILVV